MKLSQINPKPEYFDRYMNKCDDVEVLQAIETSINELNDDQIKMWRTLGDKVYTPGKWTVKDILQHLIDTERIFTYRALVFARGDSQQPPSFTEDEYALAAKGVNRSIDELTNELKHLHKATLALYRSFTPDMMARKGKSFVGEYSVGDIGFILAGHQRWHLDVIDNHYKPLLNSR